MANTNTAIHENWSSRWTFLFATIGASIGLGNLWRFPYVAGANGGGAFVIVYLFFVFAISVPLMMAELSLGRRGQQSPVNTMSKLRGESGAGGFWQAIGWLSIIAPLMALCFYAVVAGWSLDYIFKAVMGDFISIGADDAGKSFDELLASPGRLGLWYTFYIIMTVFVVSRGIKQGLEKATNFMMPALFCMIILLVIYAHVAGDPRSAWVFMFDPDFSKLSSKAILAALGQALFSVSVGTGALLTYGAYMSKDVDIVSSSWIIALTDTSAALMAGLAIFPIVFASGLDPGEGPGLMFVSLPVALGQMPGGYFFAIVFFVLVFFAAFSSSLAMLEPFVAWLTEHKGYKRSTVTMCTGFVVWCIGLSAVLSFNVLKDFTPLSFIALYEGSTMFDILDFSVSNVMLPINALLIAIFAGWVFGRHVLREEMKMHNVFGYRLWSFLVRYLAPLAVGVIVISSFTAS
jgi:neurotransmitter:Na+ symporter, NSS family